MQMKLSYYPDPGIITDAIKIISIKLNDKVFIKPSYSIYSFDEKEVNHHLQEASHFPASPKELLLFFYKDSDQKVNFMSSYLFCLVLLPILIAASSGIICVSIMTQTKTGSLLVQNLRILFQS